MGQKTNPNIFRLGKTKTWDFKYFEKKRNESGLYAFNNLELEKFVYKFFKNNGLFVVNCKINMSENKTEIFVSYYNTFKSTILLNDLNKAQKIKFISKTVDRNYRNKRRFKKKYFFLKKNSRNFFLYNKVNYKKSLIQAKKNQNLILDKSKVQRLKLLNYYKTFQDIHKYEDTNEIKFHQFFENFFDTIAHFTKKKGTTVLTLNQINKNTKAMLTKNDLKLLKKKLIQLRRYKSNSFFKDGVNLLFSYVTKNSFSKLLSQYIANELGKLKRHNFFLRFITTTLKLFIKNVSSQIKAIKIVVKGRINARPRARHQIINIGTGVPVLTLNANIDYSESTAFTPNGTLGIKVWTFKK